MPAALREERVSNKHFAPSTLSGLLADALREWGGWLRGFGRRQGRAGQGTPRPPRPDQNHINGEGFGVLIITD